ncbi:MerR family DNA-binding transcriptional regulator [Streptomyces sp. NPDC048845]|uniref:MerR family DNA-binding transcriptional regulator n=1 Tax=Streptomyces sp. NPDC048845 TaxID=3155390 RepID=UPI00343FD930
MTTDRLRAADLARLAGISVQQIRNYADTGILPPVERTASGYRVYTRVHAEALLAAREAALGHGWPTTGAVLRAVHAGDPGTALAALDASHAELARERAELAKAEEALGAILDEAESASRARERAGARGHHPARDRSRAAGARRGLRIGEVAEEVGVATPVLRLWEDRGLLRPEREAPTGYRRYPGPEVRMAHLAALLRRRLHRLDAVRAVLDELRATGDPERVREALAEHEQDLRRRSLRRLRASAALYAYLDRTGIGAAVSPP